MRSALSCRGASAAAGSTSARWRDSQSLCSPASRVITARLAPSVILASTNEPRSGYPACRAMASATCPRRRAAPSEFVLAMTSGGIAASACAAFLRRFPAPLLREGATRGCRHGRAGQSSSTGKLPAGCAALADRRVEDQAGTERGRAAFARLRSLERLAAFEPERLAVSHFRPAMSSQVGRNRAQRSTAQMTDDPGAVGDDLAHRGVEGPTVIQHAEDSTERPTVLPCRLPTWLSRRAEHFNGHGRPLTQPLVTVRLLHSGRAFVIPRPYSFRAIGRGALATLLGSDGDLGRVWRIPKPVIYRALQRLEVLGLVKTAEQQASSQGPVRSLVDATPAGRTAASAWLTRPASHNRDVRSELLVKLALLDRAGADPQPLLEAQREQLIPVVEGLHDRLEAAAGSGRKLWAWAYETASATF